MFPGLFWLYGSVTTFWFIDAVAGGRVFDEQPVGSDGALHKTSPAIWTYPVELVFDAIPAKGTFKCTDHGFRRIGR